LGEDVALRSGMSPPELSSDALALMEAQPWRGNIRELRNVLEQAAMRSDSPHIDVQQLQTVLRESGVQPIESMAAAPSATANSDPAPDHARSATIVADLEGGSGLLRPLAEQVAELEQRAIQAALRANRGNKAAAAKMLGMARATLYARLEND
ncbi:MAG: AAA family ATPase, partial [Rhodoferax sp.]|nr:AAA family ATPase [Rhodoferax sp.]